MQYIYALFSGRLGRKKFALGLLFAGLVAGIFGEANESLFAGSYIGDILIALALIILICGMYLRRLRDLGKPEWFLVFTFIPIVNFLFLLWLIFTKGDVGPNKYGAPAPADLSYDEAVFGQRKRASVTVGVETAVNK